MKNARAWKELYARERASLGARGLDELLANAPEVSFAANGAFVFPHTYLSEAGRFVAAVARAAVRSGADEVLAVGVLHGGRAEDAQTVTRAREGDALARAEMRRVHVEAGHAAEEYSLDGFAALLERAALREGRKPPALHARYPFLVGADPQALPGIDELARLRERGALLVATADPIHHGEGYGTPREERRAREDAATMAWAKETLSRQHALLSSLDYQGFLVEAEKNRCDFRDAGPVLAWLLSARAPFTLQLTELALVDYAEALRAERPTWVAAAFSQARP